MTDTETKLAEALRPFAALLQPHHANMPNDRPIYGINKAEITAGDLRRANEALAAHTAARAQPAKPDGYAYRYADGFLRFNQGAPVNCGKPIEAIPFYFAPQPAQPASVAVTYDMVRIVEHNCPVDLPHLDKQRWKAARLTEMLSAAPQPKAKKGE